MEYSVIETFLSLSVADMNRAAAFFTSRTDRRDGDAPLLAGPPRHHAWDK